jgi:hypothetical protein
VAEDVFIAGKDARLVQPSQAPPPKPFPRTVAELKSSKGKDVRELHPAQVPVNVVPDSIAVNGKLVKLVQFFQVLSKRLAELRSRFG